MAAPAVCGSSAVLAQDDLGFNTPVRGEVWPGQPETRGFNGKAGQVISLVVNSAGTLGPVLTLLDDDGQPLLTDDDFAWPPRYLPAVYASNEDVRAGRLGPALETALSLPFPDPPRPVGAAATAERLLALL